MKSFERLKGSFDSKRLIAEVTHGVEVSRLDNAARELAIVTERLGKHRELIDKALTLASNPQLERDDGSRYLGGDAINRDYESPWFRVGHYNGADMQVRLIRSERVNRNNGIETGTTIRYANLDLKITDGSVSSGQSAAFHFSREEGLVGMHDSTNSLVIIEPDTIHWNEAVALLDTVGNGLAGLTP